MSANPIPEGYHTITPILSFRDAASAIDFYKRAFNAAVTFRIDNPDGKVMHAELQIGDSRFMLGEEHPEAGCLSAQSLGGCPISLNLYVPNADALSEQALAAGATTIRPIENQPWGDRSAIVSDPFGYRWCVSTHIEDVPPEELEHRMAAMMSEG